MALEIEEAQAILNEQIQPISETEEVQLSDLPGRVLAEDIVALRDQPPFPRSPLDGYAFRGEDSKNASKENPVTLNVIGKIYAGEVFDGEVGEGEAVRLMTGAPIPAGANAVTRQEDTDEGEEQVKLFKSIAPFGNYCYQGEDYKKGEILIPAGTQVNAGAVSVISSLGKDRALVYRKARVALISSGDEVLAPGTEWKPGKIFDSNRAYIGARMIENGTAPYISVHAEDNAESVADEIRKAVDAGCDMVVTTGGVSVGEKDIMHELGDVLGAKLLFWRVRIKPGSPTMVYSYNGVPIVCLSGNPFGAIANYEILIRGMLYKLTGQECWRMKTEDAIIQDEYKKTGGRRFLRGQASDGKVSLCGAEKSVGVLHALAECNCLVEMPQTGQPVQVGDTVKVYYL